MPLDEAKKLLADLVADFPFSDDQSRTHWYAWLVTPMCRGIMGFNQKIPLAMFLANRPRAGKDYLHGTKQTLYYGNAFDDMPIAPRASEETQKRLTTALSAGRRSMHFANQQAFLDDANFIQAITAPVIYDRRLGSNDAAAQLQFKNELEFFMSGNVGLQWRDDLTPRMRVISLSYFEEDPNSRTFRYPDLHGYVRENRELLLSAVYSLVLYWKKMVRWLSGIKMVLEDPKKKLNRTKVKFTRNDGKVGDLTLVDLGRMKEKPSRINDITNKGEPKIEDFRVNSTESGSETSNLCPDVPFCPVSGTAATREGKMVEEEEIINLILNESVSTTGQNGTSVQLGHYYVDSCDGINDLLNQLEKELEGSDLYLDIETIGLNPRTDSVRLLQLHSVNSPVYVIDLDRVIFPERLKAVLNKRTVVGHNLLFDSAFLKAQHGVEIQRVWDTLSASRLLSLGVTAEDAKGVMRPLKKDLDSVLQRYLGIAPGEDFSKSNWSASELSSDQLTYAAQDVALLPALKIELLKALEAEDMTSACELENDIHSVIRDLNLTGMHVAREKLQELYRKAKQNLLEAREEVVRLLGEGSMNWNPDSGKHYQQGERNRHRG